MKFLAMTSFTAFILLLSTVCPRTQAMDFKNIINDIKDGANNFLGENGEIPRGKGCNIKWNIQGTLRGFEWKWICTCVDVCTGTAEVQTKSSREGAMEHCFKRLYSKIAKEL